MTSRTSGQLAADLPPLRVLMGGAVGMALAQGVAAQPASPPASSDAAVQMPPISVQGTGGQTGYQAWEDGGNAVPAAVSNADFFYTVQGKCDYNQRPSDTVLTQ